MFSRKYDQINNNNSPLNKTIICQKRNRLKTVSRTIRLQQKTQLIILASNVDEIEKSIKRLTQHPQIKLEKIIEFDVDIE